MAREIVFCAHETSEGRITIFKMKISVEYIPVQHTRKIYFKLNPKHSKPHADYAGQKLIGTTEYVPPMKTNFYSVHIKTFWIVS